MLKLISAVTIAFLSVCSASDWARPFTDAGGRTVEIPDNITRVLLPVLRLPFLFMCSRPKN
jgi:iron complex transport system substrate-binding protein